MSVTKIIRLDEVFHGTGEPTIQLVHSSDFRRIKTASEAQDYIRNVKPEPGYTYILVLAVSAVEHYGPNKNGDAFCELPIPGVIEKPDTLLHHYKTFETAGIYQHHVNKDLTKSLGQVVKAFYNPYMHRVELLLKISNDKAPDIVQKIMDGKYPACSMGARVAYDVCSRRNCHNKAKVIYVEYCDHAKYAMNETDPSTGEKNFVYNAAPKFFDISFVIRPADKLGYMMKKVANERMYELSRDLGAYVDDISHKLATIKKLSEITKMITGQTVDSNPKPGHQSFADNVLPRSIEHGEQLPPELLAEMAQSPLPTAMSSAASQGIQPTVAETMQMVQQRGIPGYETPPEAMDNASALQGPLLDLLHQHPEILQELEQQGLLSLSEQHVDPGLSDKLGAWAEKRSNVGDYIYRRTIGDVSPDLGKRELSTFQDPNTGATLQTTRDAIEKAQDSNLEHKAKVLAGAGALTGVGYKVLSSSRIGRLLSPLLALGAYKGVSAVSDAVNAPNFEGTNIPVNTEVNKIGSDRQYTDASIMSMLAQEYHRNGKHGSVSDMAAPILANIYKRANYNPALASLVMLNRGIPTNAIQPFIKTSSDAVALNSVDLEKLCYWIGSAILD